MYTQSEILSEGWKSERGFFYFGASSVSTHNTMFWLERCVNVSMLAIGMADWQLSFGNNFSILLKKISFGHPY